MSLSPEQIAAVQRTGQDVCVVAGPGSGKTRVLVARFRWLVENGVPPDAILAITFTEKAAAQLKDRLAKEFAHDAGLRREVERAWVSTIDGFCARLLREQAVTAGVTPDFKIIDLAERAELLRLTVTGVLDEALNSHPDAMRQLLSDFASGHLLAEKLEEVLEAIRVAGLRVRDLPVDQPAVPGGGDWQGVIAQLAAFPLHASPAGLTERQQDAYRALLEQCPGLADPDGGPRRHLEALLAAARPHKALEKKFGSCLPSREDVEQAIAALTGEVFATGRRLLLELLREIEARFEAQKRAMGVLDFADLEQLTFEYLAGHPEGREAVRTRFEHILMDELQDTNPLQWQLLDQLRSPGGFFAVGDINQSIYGFRHADPTGFAEFRNDVTAKGGAIDDLLDNYRSRPEILAAVTAFTTGAPGIEARDLHAKGDFHPRSGPFVEVLAATARPDQDDPETLEALAIAARIRELEGSLTLSRGGAPRTAVFQDFAVLVRTAQSMIPLQDAFEQFSIPYIVSGGKSFFESWEVRDQLRWLAVLENPRDEISLAAVLRSPGVGASDDALVALRSRGGNLWEAVREMGTGPVAGLDPVDQKRLLWFREILFRGRERIARDGADRILAGLLDETGVWQTLDPRRRANLNKFLGIVAGLSKQAAVPLSVIRKRLNMLRSQAVEAEAPPAGHANAVRLMTVHQAKGLEFPVVFVAALQKSARNDYPDLSFLPQAGLGVRWKVGGTVLSDPGMARFRELEKNRAKQEASRLLYVALTRAEEHLAVSWSETESGRKPSQWAKLVREALGDPAVEAGSGPLEVPAGEARVHVRCVDRPPELPAFSLRAEAEDPLVLPHLAVPTAGDGAIPATAAATFRLCPRQYYLRYYLGWPAPRAGTAASFDEVPANVASPLGAASLGTLVHKLLAGLETGEAPLEEATALAARFEQSDLGVAAGRSLRVEREFDFLCSIEGALVSGQVDLWFEDGDRGVLVDYKTDNVTAAQAPPRAEEYAVQLQLYALALRASGRKVDEAWLFFVRPAVRVAVDLSPNRLEEAIEAVGNLNRAQASRSFPLLTGEHCRRCTYYRGACPAQLPPAGQLSLFA